jgi:hypothetical protein
MTAPVNDELITKMCEATGRLILAFAQVETVLSACLRFNLSNKIDVRLSPNTTGFAAAVYGSLRFKASRDTIKRVVHEERKLTEAQIQNLGDVFEHIAHIANLRDKLAHQLAVIPPTKPDVWLLSDTYSTRRFHSRQTWQITSENVQEAASDLAAARELFMVGLTSGILLKNVPETPPTWRYKPSALKLLDPETARALLPRGRPPQPSEE